MIILAFSEQILWTQKWSISCDMIIGSEMINFDFGDKFGLQKTINFKARNFLINVKKNLEKIDV